ncbi:MAG: HlyD family efflux transporter periplasmic adaptor subunit [Prevotella sp.]|nr:HlyD family efflux transporter periplasmic adaptor subunit [Prevotella sp.]
MRTYGIMLWIAAAVLAACGRQEAGYDASGVFETTEVTVSARAQGEIVALTAEEGQEVEAGQELGHIDPTQLQLRKDQLQQTQTATSSRKLNTGQQVAAVRQQIVAAQRELQRYEQLLRDGAATQKQVDDLRSQVSVLQRQLAAAEEQVTSQNQSIDGQSQSLGAQISAVDDQLQQARIVAPIKGTVLARYAEPGEYAMPGRALLKIGNLSEMRLRAYVTADQLTQLKVGQRVTVYADEGKDGRRAYQGTVAWIAAQAEFTPKTIQTRDERANLVYAIKVSVKNDGFIKRGMYGDLKF